MLRIGRLLVGEFQACSAFLAAPERDGIHDGIGANCVLHILLQRFDILDREADMIEACRQDALADEVANAPRHDDERHLSVRQIMIFIPVAGGVLLQLENIAVEPRHFIRPHGAQRNVADEAVVLVTVVLHIDPGAVFHLALGKIEDIAIRIIRRDPGKGARRRPLDIVSPGVAAFHRLEHSADIFHLDAEMIEPGRTSSFARIDVEADITVANRDGAYGPFHSL